MHLRYRSNENANPPSRRTEPRGDTLRPFAPPLDREAIFLQLIDHELRRGRLTKATRARIVRYACGMGVSATRAGELVQACVDRLAREHATPERAFALRILDEPDPPGHVVRRLKAVVTIATSMLCYLLWWKLRE